jgi:MFS family permease
VTSALNLREEDVYVLGPPLGAGVILGLLTINALGKRLSRATAIQWGLTVTALALFGLASARNGLLFLRAALQRGGDPQPYFIALVVVSVLVLGAAYIFVTVPSFTLLQEQLADHMRGRIFGVLNTLVSVVSLAPLIVVGPIADRYGIDWVLLGGSIVVIIVLVAGRGAHLPRSARATEGSPADP